jgi:PAS domain S-box-containing protein
MRKSPRFTGSPGSADRETLDRENARLKAALAEAEARLKSAEALRGSEAKFATVFRTSPVGITLSTFADGRYLDVNDAFLRMVGYTREELLEHTSVERRVWLDAETRRRTFQELETTGSIRDREIPFRRKSGELFTVLFSCERVDMAGEAVVLTNMLDISVRKVAEERLAAHEALLAAILEQATEEIVVRDAEGRLLLANAAVRRHSVWSESFLEATSIADVPRLWGDMLDLDGNPIPPEAYPIQRVLRGETVPSMEFQRLTPDGRRRTLLHNVAPLRNAEGRLVGAVAISTEITAQKEKEAELRHARDDLEERVRARTADLQRLTSELAVAEQRERQRLAAVLHDTLQQLLVGSRFKLQHLDHAPDLAAVHGISRELMTLLGQALAACRSLTAELSPALLHTQGLVAAFHWLATWMQKTHSLNVEVQVHDPVPAFGEPTRVLVFQSVRELLFNVVKHAEVDRAKLEVRIRDDAVQVTVSDDGVGFDPANIQPVGIGGLGLPSIRQRLEYLGGALRIASARGQGSRFTVWVPLYPATAAVPSAPARPQPIRLLVADDHPVVHQALARLLVETDLQVIAEAANGEEAITLARKYRPDVILMDVNMPVLDGVEATRLIHAEYPAIRIVGLSMFEEPAQAQRMREAGAAAYVTKSGSTAGLIAAIRGTTPSDTP